MLNDFSALDPSRAFEVVASLVGIVAVSLGGCALAGVALWRVRPVDPRASWMLFVAGLVQPFAFLLVVPLSVQLGRSELAVYGAADSVLAWIVLLPACRTVIVLSLATVAVDALVVSSALLLTRRSSRPDAASRPAATATER